MLEYTFKIRKTHKHVLKLHTRTFQTNLLFRGLSSFKFPLIISLPSLSFSNTIKDNRLFFGSNLVVNIASNRLTESYQVLKQSISVKQWKRFVLHVQLLFFYILPPKISNQADLLQMRRVESKSGISTLPNFYSSNELELNFLERVIVLRSKCYLLRLVRKFLSEKIHAAFNKFTVFSSPV